MQLIWCNLNKFHSNVHVLGLLKPYNTKTHLIFANKHPDDPKD